MAYPILEKHSVDPNCRMQDYQSERDGFDWLEAEQRLAGLPDGGINIAFEAVDRHRQSANADKVALAFLAHNQAKIEHRLTYRELAEHSSRFASGLQRLGLKPGDRVYCLAGRIPELFIAALGTLKFGGVFSPLFSAFGPEPIRARLEIGQASVLVTTEKLYTKKLAAWLPELTFLKHCLVVSEGGKTAPAGTLSFAELMAQGDPAYPCHPTRGEDPALLHFTSGTTGKPKGALHVHQAVVAHRMTAQYALDLRASDTYWCTADPGWVTGTSYGILAPLTLGVTLIVDPSEFDAERWYRILQDQRVTVWYTAPTAIRMLMKYGETLPARFDLSKLRHLASVGEPLNPEAVVWGVTALGKPFHDNWWQTETGGIMIANYPCLPIKPGSMGKPMPGITAGIAHRTDEGMTLVSQSGETGELVLKAGWPSMFRAYLNEDARYRKAFQDGWYFTGDLAQFDDDGYFWFVGRADDVIKSSGHLIGPFEVESALMEHPAVAEAGVIGVPDELGGEVVKAFIALKPDFQPSEALLREVLGLARKRLGPAVAPKSIEIRDNLPKTRSGKIMRRLLKARELGLPEGDTSTMEGHNE
ncbi:MAG: acetate--CoA ligase [Saccharospirillum sp.]